MDLALLPTSYHRCSSVSTGRGMVASSILAAPASDLPSARLSSMHTAVSSGRKATCKAPRSPSRCRLSRYPLKQRRWSSRRRKGGVYDDEGEAYSACRRRSGSTGLREPEPARTWLRDARSEQVVGSHGPVGAGSSPSVDSGHHDATHGWSRGLPACT